MYRTTVATLFATLSLAPRVGAADWPQWLGPNRDSVWPETGIVEKFPKDGPTVLWRAPVAVGYSGPAVVGNRVFVTDYVTKDYKQEEYGKGGPSDFNRATLAGSERVLCFSADKGGLLWKHEYECKYEISYPGGPRCAPTVHDGKVYTLGAMGHLHCLDVEKGKILWSRNLPKDYDVKAPLFGFSGHPLVDGKKLICIVGGDGTTAVAFDKHTGKELWQGISSKESGYSSPTIIEAGGARQLVIWHGGGLAAVDPETGKEFWKFPLPAWTGVVTMVPRKDGDHLFAGTVFGTAVTLKLDPDKPAATEVWRGKRTMKDGLYPGIMTPFTENGVMYGVDQSGEFRAVKMATGERLWESWRPVTGKEESAATYGGSVYVVKNGDRFFLCTDGGESIIAKLSPKGYEEVDRCKLIEPTGVAFGRKIVWSHPAFANKCVYARNDKELICVSLAK